MLINIIGIGSFLYLISSYFGCTPTTRTKIHPIFFKTGGCPYNQTTKDPMVLKIRKCNISVRRRINDE